MSDKVRRRGILAIIIYFLMITAIWAPVGYYTGRARGESEVLPRAALGKELSRLETESSVSSYTSDGPHYYAPIVFLPDQSETLRSASTHLQPGSGIRSDAARRQNPLRDAVLRSLANDAGAGGTDTGGGQNAAGQPFSLAMAPDLAATLGPAGALPGIGAGSSMGGGSTTPSGGYPGAIVPGFTTSRTPPPGEPPVLETPIPAALPMFLSGLAACWAAARRRRKH